MSGYTEYVEDKPPVYPAPVSRTTAGTGAHDIWLDEPGKPMVRIATETFCDGVFKIRVYE